MQELQDIKKIVEKELTIDDIGLICREKPYILGRVLYYILSIEYLESLGLYVSGKAKDMVANQVGTKRLTLDHAIKTFNESAKSFEIVHLKECKNKMYRKLSMKGVNADIILLEDEIKELKEELSKARLQKTDLEVWISNFTNEQKEEIKPRIKAYMQLNRIAC